jgi:hypothetical protein
MKKDGSGTRKLLSIPIRELMTVSPDGNFVAVLLKGTAENSLSVLINKVDDGSSRNLCEPCFPSWSRDGKQLYVSFQVVSHSESKQHGQSYVLPWNQAVPWKGLGATGTRSEADFAKVATVVPAARKAENFVPGHRMFTGIACARLGRISTGCLRHNPGPFLKRRNFSPLLPYYLQHHHPRSGEVL